MIARCCFYLFVAMAFLSCNDITDKFTSSDDSSSDDSARNESVDNEPVSEERGKTKKLVAELKSEKKEIEERIEQLDEALESEADVAKKELAVVGELEEIRKYAKLVNETRAEAEDSLNKWRNATRESFKGVRLPEIETIGGAKYTDVAITNVTDDALAIEHADGADTLDIVDLPVGLRKNLIYEPTVLTERDP